MGKVYKFNQDEIDWEDFQVPATDSKGHFETLRFRCPSEMASQVAEIVSERSFRCKSMSLVCRHALRRHLTWLGTLDDKLKQRMSWMEAELMVIQKAEKMLAHSALAQELDKVVALLLGAGEKEEAKRLVLHCINVISQGSGKDSWKRKALLHIKKKHAGLISSGVSIDPAEFDKEGE